MALYSVEQLGVMGASPWLETMRSPGGFMHVRRLSSGLLVRAGCASLAVTVAFASLGVLSSGIALASTVPLGGVGSAPAGRASEASLSQAPAGLQAVVRRTLGVTGGAGGIPVQQAKLTASDGAPGDNFGYSVAISGTTAVVGALDSDATQGAAYVFVRSGTTWTQQAKLTASEPAANNYFGISVAISRSTVVVGAPGRNSSTGIAYVFVRSGTTWSQQARLTASDATIGDYFGGSVAISGSIAVVGAFQKNSTTGAAYVFVRSGTVWSQQAELTASDGATNDGFGSSVAIFESTVIVGAPDEGSGTGAAYVFVRPGTVWSQQAELTASDATLSDGFGSSVAISGSTVVVGAANRHSGTGAAYVFVRSGTTWSQQGELTASDGATNANFGISVAISGSTVVVGAAYGHSGTGAAYVFVRSGTMWSQQAELTASDATLGDNFGISVAISGTSAVVGARFNKERTGAAYAFGDV